MYMYFILPGGLTSLFEKLINYTAAHKIIILILVLIEVFLVIKRKYPRILPTKFRWLNGILFYALINIITNLIYFGLWRDGII